MSTADSKAGRLWTTVAIFSIALSFFSVPHVLEDFVLGEPLKRGLPQPIIAFVVSLLFAGQGVGLLWLGQRRRLGLWVHAALGGVWALAAGSAQLPELLAAGAYRSGAISAAYVLGIIAVGATLTITSVATLRGWGEAPRTP